MKKLLLFSVSILALTGCGLLNPVPVTTVKGSIAGQPFYFQSPKDTTMTNLSVTVGTNGTASIQVGYISGMQNTTAITASYAGAADIVAATANAVMTAAKTAGAAVATSGASLAK